MTAGQGAPTVAGEALATYVPRLLIDGRGRAGPEHWEVEGTLVFADVSGFTRLTERLSKQGKAGAEEMVTIISSVFTELLSATADGGDVLKFGGDALLILFSGPDHAVRACHAAQGMQRAIRRVGSIASSQGRVRLRMSVGVHSGTFPMFLAGADDALELLVVGEGATCTVDTESAADAGEILVSPATAAQLDPDWLGETKGPGVLVRRIPPQPPLVVVSAAAPPGDIERFVPRLLRGRLGPGAEEHEHRRVAISFVHFGGVDALVRERGPAAAFEHVNALTVAVQDVIDDLGVLLVCTDIGGDGGKFMLAAGAPDASEDDEGRLLRAVHRIVTADVGIPIRAGVNHGHVFAGDVGAPFRRTYSTMGDPVNLAARVMGKAPFGRVLATRSVVEAATGRFRTEALPPFRVKGKSQPVDALLVDGPLAAAPPRLHGSELPLVARDAELAAIDAAVAAARRGVGGVVELLGEVGVGKSRLVAEVATRHRDVRVLAVAGDPYARTSPYHVAGKLLRPLFGVPPDANAEDAGRRLHAVVQDRVPALSPWLPLLAIPVAARVEPTPEVDATDARFRSQRMRSATADLLAALDPTGIVVIESVEHVDDASADLLGHVLAQLTDRHWCALLTRRADVPRPSWCDLDDVVEVPLAPLPADAAAQLLTHASEHHPIPVHLTGPILDRAGGNPLFLLELVRSVAEAGATTIDQLPNSVEAVFASALDSLDVDDRRALRHLSVLGAHAPAWLIDAALGDFGVHADDVDRWRRLEAFVMRTTDGLAFLGDLARHAAYERLTFQRRRELHGRVAEVLVARGAGSGTGSTDRDDLALVSWHLEQAERWAAAWPLAVAAGDAASAAYANTEAIDAYRRALTAATHLPDLPPEELAAVAERCGDACEVAALYPQATEAYRVARGAAPDPVDRLRLLRKQGVVEERVGRYTAALRWYGRALREAESLAGADVAPCVAALHNAYAGVRLRQGRLRDCVRHARQAAEVATRHADTRTLAHAHYLLDAAHTDLGEDDQAEIHRHEALPIFERVGDLVGQANVLNNLGTNAFFAGDLDDARRLYERSRTARMQAGDVVGAATADNNIAEVLIEQGQLDAADDLLRAALRVWRGARYPVGVALATRNLGTVAMRRGDVEAATAHLAAACRIFRQIGADAFLAETETILDAVGDVSVRASTGV